MSLPIDLTGGRALVTGVTSGIGAGIAAVLATAGCDVAGCGLEVETSEPARQFRATIAAAGRNAFYAQADLVRPDGPADLVAQAEGAFGGIDIVVSNAGRNVFRGASACTEAEWNDCMELDLASHWRLAKAWHASQKRAEARTGPVAIFIGSNHADRTIAGCFPYNVAKAGVHALARALAIEWGPTVRAVAIAPGFIDTPGNDAWFAGFPDPAAERHRTEQRHPAGRLGTPTDVGNLCAFLASPLAGFLTGTTVVLDGGRGAILQDA